VDSDFALFHMQRALWDPVDPVEMGSLADSLHFRVNGEVYRFANARNRQRFASSPELWCGLLRDPVSGERFWPSAVSPQAYWVGGPYFFASEASKSQFLSDPKKYEVRRAL
jgi:YHS domain-containing protein